MKLKKVRTRYAPSPTGYLHIGGARTALFNYLLAKHFNGEFVVRIEDTDVARNVINGEKSQLDNLKWLGITPDEDPTNPNIKYGKYRQSEKLERYNLIIEKMIDEGHAYYAYDNSEELQNQKEEQEKNGISSFRFDRNWLKISDEEKRKRHSDGNYSIRFKVDKNVDFSWNDLVRGKISFNSNDIGDFVIKKSDGFPTYNFAVVVDDIDMEISHVLRGEEHISNTPKQIAIYKKLKKEIPIFGHLTLITNMEGKKLSKRDTSLNQFIEDYKNEGFVPEAVFNFLALLGWTSSTSEEFFTKEKLISEFDYKRLSKSPSKFDIQKMNWFSKNYMKNLSNELIEKKLVFKIKKNPNWINKFIDTYKNSSTTFSEMQESLNLFEDEKIIGDYELNDVLKTFIEKLNIDNFSVEEIQEAIDYTSQKLNIKGKNLFMPIRKGLTGIEHGPELATCIFLHGKEKILARIESIK